MGQEKEDEEGEDERVLAHRSNAAKEREDNAKKMAHLHERIRALRANKKDVGSTTLDDKKNNNGKDSTENKKAAGSTSASATIDDKENNNGKDSTENTKLDNDNVQFFPHLPDNTVLALDA